MNENVPGLEANKSAIQQQMITDATKATCPDNIKAIIKYLDARGIGNNKIGRLPIEAGSSVNHFRKAK